MDLSYFVTNFDIKAIFKNAKIVRYADLDNFKDIYELLPNRMDFVFLLTESQKNSGHWTLLIRDDNVFEYYDSYGTSPKSILDYIPSFTQTEALYAKALDCNKMPVDTQTTIIERVFLVAGPL